MKKKKKKNSWWAIVPRIDYTHVPEEISGIKWVSVLSCHDNKYIKSKKVAFIITLFAMIVNNTNNTPVEIIIIIIIGQKCEILAMIR